MSIEPRLSATTAGRSNTYELALLGFFEARRAGELVELGGARARGLVALLALHLGAVVSVDRIVEDLWGEESPASAHHMVQVYVSRLRQLLGDGIVVTRRPGYTLGVEPEQLDVVRFERLFRDGREAFAAGDAGSAAGRFAEALGLWRGPALADFAYEPFAQAEIARLEELRLEAEEERIEAELALGRGSELVAELETLVAAAPLRERRRSLHMHALYRAGRQADALSAYQEARRTFVDELGIEPGQELRELERAILAQDEQLLKARPGPSTSPPQSRRTVTLMVARLVRPEEGSEDPETDRALSEAALAQAREVIERFGGSVEELPDGTALAAFGTLLAHEDDSLRAVRAADELRRVGVISRAGLETGEIVVAPGSPTSGAIVRAASGLNESAGPGDILLGEAVGWLVRDTLTLEPVQAKETRCLRLVGIDADAPPRPLRFDAPLVGRADLLAGLRVEFERAVVERRARLVTVVGEPGIGKSRLGRELIEALASDAQVLIGRCPAYGEGLTYRPLREMVRAAIAGDDRDAIRALLVDEEDGEKVADRIASVLAGTEEHPVEELRWAAQRFLRRLSFEQPLLVLIEDAHWAEPTFLDLLEHVVAASRDAPMLVLCLVRPEFLDEHPESGGTTILVESLSKEESAELLALLAPGLVDGEIVETGSGNPLFIEQLAAFAAERRGGERTEMIPPTLRSLLAARLDRLGPGERAILERAAVAGHEFWTGGVAELLPPAGRETLERHLGTLIDKGLLESGVSVAPFERAYRFRHVLIQAAAYRSLPKKRRSDLHERLAGWLAGNPGAAGDAEEEIVGYHLEQAYRYRAELGLLDDETRALAARAGDCLGSAGEAAVAQNDLPAAATLLTRAIALREAAGQPRLDLLVDLGTALLPLGENERALAVLDEAIEGARVAGEPALEWRAKLQRTYLLTGMKPGGVSIAEALQTDAQALQALEGLGDDRALARVWRSVTQNRFALGHHESAVAASEPALEYARRAGDRQEETWTLATRCAALAAGPRPAREAAAECEDLLAGASNQTQVACALESLGVLRAMQGELREGRRLVEHSLAIYEELGLAFRVAVCLGFYRSDVHMLAGDLAGAEHDLRAAIDHLDSIGDTAARSTVTAYLADVLYGLGRHVEAEAEVDIAEYLTAPDDWRTLACLWSVRAKILAWRGETEQSKSAADLAIGFIDEVDDLNLRGALYMAKAEVQRLAGEAEAAASCLEQAIDLGVRKGNAVLAERARARLLELAPAAGLRRS